METDEQGDPSPSDSTPIEALRLFALLSVVNVTMPLWMTQITDRENSVRFVGAALAVAAAGVVLFNRARLPGKQRTRAAVWSVITVSCSVGALVSVDWDRLGAVTMSVALVFLIPTVAIMGRRSTGE